MRWRGRRLYLDRSLLPRWLAVWLGLRRLSPDPDDRRPSWRDTVTLPLSDTGGATFRPPFRRQDPSKDPTEPQGGEGSSAGEDHGWNGCTMTSGGMAHGWHRQAGGDDTPWGGDMRHAPGQPDLSGGTDLYDLRAAWDGYSGAELKIKSGQGWGAVRDARGDWRAIVLQGEGNTPGSGTYTGAHAIVVLPERHDSGEWLMGDPLVTGGADGYQWVPESKLREWAERFSSGVAFAVTKAWPPSPPEPPEPPTPGPEPPEPPGPPPVPVRSDAAAWDLLAPPSGPLGVWARTSWPGGARWDELPWDDARWPIAPAWSLRRGAWPSALWPTPLPSWDRSPWSAPWA